jgi:hypothetical protein
MSSVGIFSGGATETIEEEIEGVLLTAGRDARRAVAKSQLVILQQLPDDEDLLAVAADEFNAQVVVAVGERHLVLLHDGGRALLRTAELAGLSSVYVEPAAVGGFVASIGGTGVGLRLRARATADRLRSLINGRIIANRPRRVPVLYPSYFTDLLTRAGVPVTPANVARLVERTAFMIGCQGAAYCAHLGDPVAFEDLVERYGRGGPVDRRLKLVDDIVDWLWAWSPSCHGDLPSRFDKWRDGLLRPGSFLVRGHDVPAFDESGSDADHTAAWRAVFAKNRRSS